MVTEQGWHKSTVAAASSLYSIVEWKLLFPRIVVQGKSQLATSCLTPWDLWGALMGNTVLTRTEASSIALSACCCHSVRPHHMLMLQSADSGSCGMVEGGCRTEVGSTSKAEIFKCNPLYGSCLRGSFTFALFCGEQTPFHQSINATEEAGLSSHVSVDHMQ